nr:ADP-ribosylglycohydrolase family protein [Blastococcus aggregatus]
MRATPSAIWFSGSGTDAPMDAARGISALTHGDPSSGGGCAILAELSRATLDGGDPLAAIPTLALVTDQRGARWATVLADSGRLSGDQSNSEAWPTPGSAIWAAGCRGFADKLWRLADLQQLAAALDGAAKPSLDPGVIPRIGSAEVLPGIWAACSVKTIAGGFLRVGTDVAAVTTFVDLLAGLHSTLPPLNWHRAGTVVDSGHGEVPGDPVCRHTTA